MDGYVVLLGGLVALLVGLAAGDHVEQQPAPGDPLVGGRHLGRERGRDQAWPERDQEFSRWVWLISAAVTSQASSHQAPVGVSTDSNPACSAAAATWLR